VPERTLGTGSSETAARESLAVPGPGARFYVRAHRARVRGKPASIAVGPSGAKHHSRLRFIYPERCRVAAEQREAILRSPFPELQGASRNSCAKTSGFAATYYRTSN